MHNHRQTPGLIVAGLAALVLPSILAAQITFERTYGGGHVDFGNSVDLTSDGGYVVAGCTKSFGLGGPNIYLVRTDSFGDTLWTRTYGGDSTDVGASVQQTFDGGFIVAGWTRSFGAGGFDAYLVKTDAAGDTQWTRTFGGTESDDCWSVQQTADSGYILAGLTASSGADSQDVYLIKTDASGDTLWTRMYGGPRNEYSSSVQQTREGGYIVTGTTASFGAGDYDVYLIKTDAHGDTMWTRTFGGAAADYGRSVRQTMDGGYIVAGLTESFGAGGRDVYLIKTDSTGAGQWVQFYGDTTDDGAYSICQTSNGGYIIAGYTELAGPWDTGVYLIRTDASGHSLWTRTYGDNSYDYGWSIRPTTDGGYVVAGQYGQNAGDVYLVKTDSLGRTVAVSEQGPSLLRDDMLKAEPSPFQRVVNIRCGPGLVGTLSLNIFDAAGRAVRRLPSARDGTWDGRDESGSLLPAGAYFIEARAGSERRVVQVLLAR
jgi:hypothetical protein